MDSKLITKYFSGKCTPEEVQQVLTWFNSQEPTTEQEQDLRVFWQKAESEKEKFAQDSAKIFAGIQQKINQLPNQFAGRSTVAKSSRRNILSGRSIWLAKVAAAVLFPVFFLWLLSGYLSDVDNSHTETITAATSPGTRKSIRLEDGSLITLNGASTISYLPHFTAQRREITLTGEAFFEVAKDSLRPFIVKTGNLSTQALGTSFNIKYHAHENTIAVALATGVVKIGNGAKQSQIARLNPGQQLVFNRTDHKYKVGTYEPLDVLGWREGVLYFKQANLQQVINKLESLYGVDIEISGKIPAEAKDWRYTGTYSNESLENVLEGISFVKFFTYEKSGRKVKIKFN